MEQLNIRNREDYEAEIKKKIKELEKDHLAGIWTDAQYEHRVAHLRSRLKSLMKM